MNVLAKLALAGTIICAANMAHAQKAQHPCAKDAAAKGNLLLKFHFLEGEEDKNFKATVGDDVKVLPPVKAVIGNGRFDVLEVWAAIYRTEYRMRFLYTQTKGSCILIGQEIIQASNPY